MALELALSFDELHQYRCLLNCCFRNRTFKSIPKGFCWFIEFEFQREFLAHISSDLGFEKFSLRTVVSSNPIKAAVVRYNMSIFEDQTQITSD